MDFGRDSLYDRPIRRFNDQTQNPVLKKKYMLNSNPLNDNALKSMVQNIRTKADLAEKDDNRYDRNKTLNLNNFEKRDANKL